MADTPTFLIDQSDNQTEHLSRRMRWPARGSVRIMGLRIAAVTEQEAVAGIVDAAASSRGQWTITANLDHLRRYQREPLARRLLESADTVVADGAPLVWASRIAGTPLPERVAGADMIWSISEAAARSGVSIFLLGGNPGVAEHAADVLRKRFPDIDICGTLCPPHGFDRDESHIAIIEEQVDRASPGIVLVALGFPKQDILIKRLRDVLPHASFVGVGISLSFVTGEIRRAPAWTHTLGLEWFDRLLHEPKRLVERYLIRGVPFALLLLISAARHRVRSGVYGINESISWGMGDGRTTSDAIHHFGPDPAEVGGMSSVIRVLTEHRVGGDIVEFHPTWREKSRAATFRLTIVAALAILRMRHNTIVHVHLSERGSFIREGALVVLARRWGLITAITIHGADFLSFAGRHPRLVSRVLRHAALITCLDQDVLDWVRRAAPRARVEILPNPVLMDDAAHTADHTSELVVFAGEIGLRKGADVLLDAWRLVAARRPQARCVMVGPIIDFAVPKVERLTVRGPINADEMKDLLRSARVVALPSRAEGMPMVLTEAMSGGRPFVSTPVGGISELAREGGMLVEVGDEIGLARCLADLLADPALARSMGERARRFCFETRSVEVIDARLRELYIFAAQG